MELPLFNPQGGNEDKEEALDRVLRNAGSSFVDRASAAVTHLFGGQVVMAEDWRRELIEHGITPHHSNAWGGLTNSLYKRGVIRPTDQLSKSKDRRSHSRRQPLWAVKHSSL